MTRGMVTLSTIFHAIVFAVVTFGIPDLFSDPEASATIIPVEIVEIAEETNITTKRAPAKPAEEPKVEPVKKAAVPPPPSPSEPKVVAKATPKPEAPRATSRAQPREKPNVRRKPDFDLNQIAALLDKKQPEPRSRQAEPDPRAVAVQTSETSISDAPRFTLSERDALKAQLYRCWNVPVGALDAKNLVVKVRVFLNRDGTLARPPQLSPDSQRRMDEPFYRVAAESALRAVKKCEPLILPPAKYEEWRDILLRFDPGEMLS